MLVFPLNAIDDLVDHGIEGAFQIISLLVFIHVIETTHSNDSRKVLVCLVESLVEYHYHVVFVLSQLRILKLKLVALSLSGN